MNRTESLRLDPQTSFTVESTSNGARLICAFRRIHQHKELIRAIRAELHDRGYELFSSRIPASKPDSTEAVIYKPYGGTGIVAEPQGYLPVAVCYLTGIGPVEMGLKSLTPEQFGVATSFTRLNRQETQLLIGSIQQATEAINSN